MKLMASLLHLESLNRLKFIKVDSASSYNFLIVFVLQKYKMLRPYTEPRCRWSIARLRGKADIYWAMRENSIGKRSAGAVERRIF